MKRILLAAWSSPYLSALFIVDLLAYGGWIHSWGAIAIGVALLATLAWEAAR